MKKNTEFYVLVDIKNKTARKLYSIPNTATSYDMQIFEDFPSQNDAIYIKCESRKKQDHYYAQSLYYINNMFQFEGGIRKYGWLVRYDEKLRICEIVGMVPHGLDVPKWHWYYEDIHRALEGVRVAAQHYKSLNRQDWFRSINPVYSAKIENLSLVEHVRYVRLIRDRVMRGDLTVFSSLRNTIIAISLFGNEVCGCILDVRHRGGSRIATIHIVVNKNLSCVVHENLHFEHTLSAENRSNMTSLEIGQLALLLSQKNWDSVRFDLESTILSGLVMDDPDRFP